MLRPFLEFKILKVFRKMNVFGHDEIAEIFGGITKDGRMTQQMLGPVLHI